MELKEHNIDRTLDMIVRSYILLVQEAAKLMAPRGGGKVVAISGGDTSKYQQRHGLLAAAKAAMETITRYIGVELAEQRIIANAVLPGPFDTDSARIYAASTGMDWETFIRGWVNATPYRRLGTIVRRVPVEGPIVRLAQPIDGPLVYGACPDAGGLVVVDANRGRAQPFLPCGQRPTDVIIVN